MPDPQIAQILSRLSALETQTQSLRNQLRGSFGVSTGNAGALNIRTTQLGFPAELTSDYDATTGYDWKRLRLDPPDFVNPGVQLTGDKAFEVTGDETLESGQKVWMEPSPDAVGYVFMLSGATSSGSGDCSSLLGNLKAGFCGTLTIGPGEGSCDCIPVQTTAMTWDADLGLAVGVDYVYGCPPGVDTTICPDPPTGGPNKYKIVAAGFTGDCTALNATWTFTWSSGETWTAGSGDITATLVLSAGPVMTVTFTIVDGAGTHTITYSAAADCCEDVVLDRVSAAYCAASPATLTAQVVTGCGNGPPYIAYLDKCADSCGRPAPRLRLVPVSGSGSATITFANAGCSETSGANFTTNDPVLCTGDSASECEPNSVAARVVCGCDDVPPNIFDECPLNPGGFCLQIEDLSGSHPELNQQVFLTPYYPGSYTGFWTVGGVFPTTPTSNRTCCDAPGSSNRDCVAESIGSAWLYVQCVAATEDPTKFMVLAALGVDTNPYCWRGAYTRFAQTGDAEYTGLAGMSLVQDNPSPCGYAPNALTRWTIINTSSACPGGNISPTCPTSPLESYNCLPSGSCIDPGDGSGTYTGATALADCEAACSGGGVPSACCPEAAGGLASLIITGGLEGGTYSSTWVLNDPPGIISATWTVGSAEYQALCTSYDNTYTAAGVFALVRSVSGVVTGSGAATSQACLSGLPALSFPAGIAPGGATSIIVT